MFPFQEQLYFHREHTWIRLEPHERGDRFRIGLDKIFLHDVGPIASLDLPHEGDEISQDEICGVIRGKERSKLLYAPLSGEILDVNLELHEEPEVIGEDPYGVGWLLLIDPSHAKEELEHLLKDEEAAKWWKHEIEIRRSDLSPE